MIVKKCPFPIFMLTVVALLLQFSCTKNPNKKVNPQFDKLVGTALEFHNKQQFDSALVYFYKAKLACSDEELDRISYSLYYIAEIQKAQCDFSGSEATVTEALRINPKYKNNYNLYNVLGLSYQEQFDFDNAKKYYNLCLSTTTKELEKCVVKNNIGYVLLESKKYKEAAKVFNELVTNDSLIQSKPNYAKVLDNLGFAYFKLDNPKALGYLNQSLQIRDSIKDNSELIASYMHLAEYYLTSNATVANDFAQKAYVAATAINSPDDRMEAIKFLIASSTADKIKSLALKQITISDSINKIRQNSKTQFAKIKYDSNLALKESDKQKSQKQLYLSLFIFVSTLSVVIISSIRAKNKRKLRKATYETETKISKKLHDELANDVFNALTYAETQDLNNPTNKEFLLENLDKIYTQSRNISKENSPIDTGNNFEALLKAMLSSYNSPQINVILKNNTSSNDWLKLQKESKIVVYRTLQELMVNMRKHSQCSLVVIGFDRYKNGLEINYSDNGIGCPEMLNFKKGLQNVENRILSINGTITFETETNKGFKAKLKLPK